MCWNTQRKQPSADGAHTTVKEARYADWNVREKGWFPNTLPKSHLQMCLAALADCVDTSESETYSNKNISAPQYYPISKSLSQSTLNDVRGWGMLRFSLFDFQGALWSAKQLYQRFHRSRPPPVHILHWLYPVGIEISRACQAATMPMD